MTGTSLVNSVTATEATCPIIYQVLHNSGSSAVNVGIRSAPRSLRSHQCRRRCVCRVSLCKSGYPDGTCEPGATTILRAFTNDFCAFILRYQRTNTLNNFRLELDPLFFVIFCMFLEHTAWNIYTVSVCSTFMWLHHHCQFKAIHVSISTLQGYIQGWLSI